jgi:hypothetical protein
MYESGLYFRAHPNKTLAQGKVRGQKLQKERVTFALVANSNVINKLKLFRIFMSKQP